MTNEKVFNSFIVADLQNNLDQDKSIDEVFYLLPNEKGLYNTEIYFKEIKKYHFKFSPAKTDKVIHYKGEIPAKKWDLPEC